MVYLLIVLSVDRGVFSLHDGVAWIAGRADNCASSLIYLPIDLRRRRLTPSTLLHIAYYVAYHSTISRISISKLRLRNHC